MYYFPFYGRVEVLAQLLSHAKADWEFVPVERDQVAKYKEEGKSEFGQFPIAEINGKFYAQTDAILRLLGRKHGYYPEDPEKAFLVDSAIDGYKDVISKLYQLHFEQDMEKKKQGGADFLGKVLPGYFTVIEKRLTANGNNGYFIGEKFTIADFYVGSFLTNFPYNEKFEQNEHFREVVEKFPAVKKFADNYLAQLKEHLDKRPKLPF